MNTVEERRLGRYTLRWIYRRAPRNSLFGFFVLAVWDKTPNFKTGVLKIGKHFLEWSISR